MSISGSLEDVSVADVMQFIHLGRRTGTLVLTRDDQQARIGFHNGKLVSAHTPGVQRLGTLLVDQGLLDQTTLDDAVAVQKREESPRSLGQILVGNGDVDGEELRQAIVGQIETAVSRAVSWERGSFEFVVDNLQPVDDIAIYPGDLVPDSDINTQMVLLEAARIFDERNRDRLAAGEGAERDDDDTLPVGTRREAAPAVSFAAPPQRAEEQLLEPHAVDAAFEDAGMGPLTAPFQRLWLDVVSQDADFVHDLVAALPDEVPHVQRVDLEEAGAGAPGHMAPVVLVDLRDGRITPEALRALHRARPRVASVALVDEGGSFSEAYAAGAKAALPASPEGVTACIENLLQLYRARVENEAPPTPRRGRDGVARLRRVFGDLRSGLISATVALNLMHIISESVERAVLFLVKRDDLTALGAFGLGVGGQPLAEATRGLRIGLDEDNALTWTLEEGEARAMAFEEAGLPERFAELLGRPKTGQVVIFPVLGAQRVISIIYTDNGDRDEGIEDIEILELATAQVGMAFENELLRRQISEP
jgi:hypothetical protein